MKFIGITGGVGAGKTEILSYLREKPNSKVLLADEIAHKLMVPGTKCYNQIAECFVEEDIFEEQIFDGVMNEVEFTLILENPPFDRKKLAEVIFSDPKKREEINKIIHPAVKEYVKKQYYMELEKGELDLLVLEAALLIEEDYDEICDEIWYIYTSEETRSKRLMESRGYSKEKVKQIFKSQLSEKEFREGTQVTIDNNGYLVETYNQIEKALRRNSNE